LMRARCIQRNMSGYMFLESFSSTPSVYGKASFEPCADALFVVDACCR
jgi:hypothetical protein